MAKMTNAQARKRIAEAQSKFMKVYMSTSGRVRGRITTQDMMAMEKLCAKIIDRLNRAQR